MTHKNLKEKQNLVLIQAYPANSTLTVGAISYLEEFFNVYFIDLPGFHPDQAPLEEISLEAFAQNIADRIEKLGLDSYVLSGISFGALIANYVPVDDKCLFILAIEPFLGYKYIKIDFLKRLYILGLIEFAKRTNIANKMWDKEWFRDILSKTMGKSEDMINVVLEEMDPKAFIITAEIALKYKEEITFQDKPYVLLLNPQCHLIKFDDTLYQYVRGIENKHLRVILTTVEHYPEDPSYEYFKKHLSMNELESLFNFSDYLYPEVTI